jgi:hypothetical protein
VTKTRTKHLGEHLPPVKLYLDDIAKIYDALHEAGERITIETPEYECTEPAELATLGVQQLRGLKIQCADPYLTVDITSREVWLYAAADDNVSRGLFEKIKELLRRRHRWIARRFSGTFGAVPILVALGIGFFAVPDHWTSRPRDSVPFLAGLGSISLLLVVIALFAWYQVRGTNWVLLTNRNQAAPGFWRRNGDKLIVGGILAIVSAAIGALATYWRMK